MNSSTRYTYDLQSVGTILAPGEEGQRPTVFQGDTANPLDGNVALAVVTALDYIARDKTLALAVRREINRLFDPAEYESEKEIFDQAALGNKKYDVSFLRRGPGEQKETDHAEVYATNPGSAVQSVILEILDDDCSENAEELCAATDFTVMSNAFDDKFHVYFHSTNPNFHRPLFDEHGGVQLQVGTVEKFIVSEISA